MNQECTITMRAIVQRVSRARGVPERHFYGQRRDKKTSDARNMVYWLARDLPGLSHAVIGRLLGGRDPSTISQQCKVVDEARGADPALAAELDSLRASLEGSARLQLSGLLADPDPIAVAQRIALSVDPIRTGMGASALEIAAMAVRANDLEEIVAATFQLLLRCNRARSFTGAAAALFAADTRELIDVIASALEALGYAQETEDDNDEENRNTGSAAAAE